MKTVRLLLTIALLAVAGVATANNYEYNIHLQDDVVIGEDAPVVTDQAVPAPSVESYGVMPSWATGCCERQPSKADHLWDNYCFEKHSGCCKHRGCCGKTFCGTSPFSKGCCCKSKCGPKFHLPKLHMPKLNVWNKCCQKTACVKSTVKSCTQKCHRPKLLSKCCQKSTCCQKPVCKKPVCQKSVKGCAKSVSCRKPLLSKFRLFRGCHGSKCGKGKGATVVTSSNYGDAIPSPAIEGEVIESEMLPMPGDVPPAPAIEDPAA